MTVVFDSASFATVSQREGSASIPASSSTREPTINASSIHQPPVTHPGGLSNGDCQIGEEVPADVAAGDFAAELRVVAERQTNDAGAVAVIRNPRLARRHGEQGVEAERELAERAPRVAGALHLCLDEFLSGCSRHLDHSTAGRAFREFALGFNPLLAVPAR